METKAAPPTSADDLPYEVTDSRAYKRPSDYTLEEMRIIASALRFHMLDPKGVPLNRLSKEFNIAANTLIRHRKRMEKNEKPFKTPPSEEVREPFTHRAKHEKHMEIIRRAVTRYSAALPGSSIPVDEPGEQQVEDILAGAGDVSEKRRRLLTIAQDMSVPETVRIHAELAEAKIAAQHGETEKGPGAPLTIGDSIFRLSMLMQAVGWETAKKSMIAAYGEERLVGASWKAAKAAKL